MMQTMSDSQRKSLYEQPPWAYKSYADTSHVELHLMVAHTQQQNDDERAQPTYKLPCL